MPANKTEKTKKTPASKNAHHHVPETVSTLEASTNKEVIMPTINQATTASHSSPLAPAPAVVPAAPVEIAAHPAPAVTPASPSPASGAGGLTTGFLAPPPPADPAFVPPVGFVPGNTMDFRGVLPRTSELVALPIAVADLGKFADYAKVMGSKAPPIAQLLQAFDVTNQWSSARTEADAWDKYARTQEGVAWTMLRRLMARTGPAFVLAVGGDPQMAALYPGLTTLLDAKKTIAHKAVATKKANRKNAAAGEPPTHGKVGKRATKAAEKAALAEKRAAEVAGHTVPATPATPVPAHGAAPAGATPTSLAQGAPANGPAATAVVTPAAAAAPSALLNGTGSGSH